MKREILFVVVNLFIALPVNADLSLAMSKNCMSCHAVNRKLLGPAFEDISAKYKDEKNVLDLLATKIIQGGVGSWGAIPMPANSHISEADAKKLAAWILTTK